MRALVVFITLSLFFLGAFASSCRCNGQPSAPLPMRKLPNAALKIARISLTILPGTPATPHAFAIVMASMYDAFALALSQPRLTNATMAGNISPQRAEHMVVVAGAAAMYMLVQSDPVKLRALRKAVTRDFTSGIPIAMAVMQKFRTAPMPSSPYVPPNPPSKVPNVAQCRTVSNPSGWQPLCLKSATSPGVCTPQKSMLARLSRAPLVSLDGGPFRPILARGIRTPKNDVPLNQLFKRKDLSAFAKQYRRLLRISSPLTDRHKTIAEKFSPPAFISLLGLVVDDLALHGADLFQSVRTLFLVMGSVRDALVTVATFKQEVAVIRPITVLQCGLIGEKMSIWQGPYMGMSPNKVQISFQTRWTPYLTTPSSASFPSGHTAAATSGAFAYMLAVGWRLPKVSNCIVQKPGASKLEGRILRGESGFKEGFTNVPNKGPYTAGFVPAKKTTICWHSWSRYAKLTALSRLYGGIHTPQENAAAEVIGRRAARRMFAYMNKLE